MSTRPDIMHFAPDDFLGSEVYYCPTHGLVWKDKAEAIKHSAKHHDIVHTVDIVKHWYIPGGELVVQVKQVATE